MKVLKTIEGEKQWEAVLAVEGVPTIDGRFFPVDSLAWRELPLSLMAQLTTAEGHNTSQPAGRIDEIWREPQKDGTALIMGKGAFDAGEVGQDVWRMVDAGTLSGLSVDVANKGVELRDGETGLAVDMEDADAFDVMMSGKYQTVLLDGTIGAATVVAFPAFDAASISVVASGDYSVRIQLPLQLVAADLALTASAAGLAPERPPTSWFEDPQLTGPTPFTIGEDGRAFGHLATWDTCHIGMGGNGGCTTAPKSRSDYSFFHLGELETEEGDLVSVGKVTLDTGHASLAATRGATVRHYDDTGTTAAYVRAGEDEFGIWVAGAVDAAVAPAVARKLRASALSGDWRRVNGSLELVAALAVNVPGFPIPRAQANVVASAEHDQTLALVAAGVLCACDGTMSTDEARTRIEALGILVFAADARDCPECGKENPGDASKCQSCGHAL